MAGMLEDGIQTAVFVNTVSLKVVMQSIEEPKSP
jgi:hypothetical protein